MLAYGSAEHPASTPFNVSTLCRVIWILHREVDVCNGRRSEYLVGSNAVPDAPSESDLGQSARVVNRLMSIMGGLMRVAHGRHIFEDSNSATSIPVDMAVTVSRCSS